jgi:hypothetical protein
MGIENSAEERLTPDDGGGISAKAERKERGAG